MKILKSGLVIVVLVMVGFACSKKDNVKQQQKKKKVKAVPPIIQLDVVPEIPISGRDVEVFPVLTDEAKGNDVTLMVQWLLNGDTLEDESELYLSKDKFTKGDKVQCIVMASLNGRHLQTIKTEKLKINNAPPVIHFKMPGSFEIPGSFYYKIKASDPDNDELRYSLISPLNRGIRLNEATGEIEWYISQQLLDQMAEEADPGSDDMDTPKKKNTDKPQIDLRYVRVEFQVADTDNASDRGFFLLDFVTRQESDPI